MKLFYVFLTLFVYPKHGIYTTDIKNTTDTNPEVSHGDACRDDFSRKNPFVEGNMETSKFFSNGQPSSKYLIRKRDVSKEKTLMNPCEKFGSCHANTGKYIPICYCDSDCSIYQDCCHDAHQQTTSQPILSESNERKSILSTNETILPNKPVLQNNTAFSVKYETCETVLDYYIKSGVSGHLGVRMISKCPNDYQHGEVKAACERLDNLLPVSLSSGDVYRNSQCAICHGHDETNCIFWDIMFMYNGYCTYERMSLLNLSILEKVDYIRSHKSCQIVFGHPRGTTFRTCLKHSPNMSIGMERNEMCSKFQNPLMITKNHGDTQLQRNVYCHEEAITTINNYYCFVSSNRSRDQSKGVNDFAMTGMFHLRPAVKKQCKMDPENPVSLTLDTCTSGNCLEICGTELVKNLKWKTIDEFNFISNADINLDTVLRITKLVCLSLPEKYRFVLQRLGGLVKCGIVNDPTRSSCCQFQGGASFINEGLLTFDEANRFLLDVRKMKWVFNEVYNATTITISNAVSETSNTECNVTMASQYRLNYSAKGRYKAGGIFVSNNISRPKNDIPERITGTVIMKQSADSRNLLTELEFQYMSSNDTNSTSFTADSLSLSVSSIMTFVTQGVSCVSLSVTIGLYTYFGLFRSSPGKISQHMMASLLAAQLIFISSATVEYIQTVCFIVGIISHYIWLCAFSWISVFQANVLMMMRNIHINPAALPHEQKFSKVNLCVGYILPGVIVLPCLLLDVFGEVHIGYDGNMCFPTGFPANIYVFSLPVAISIIVNLVVLATSSIALARYNSTIQHSFRVKKMRDYIPMYIKLGFLCACPWILGILSSLYDSDILRYIFILLAGSHGSFVSVAFLCRDVIFNKAKRCFVNQPAQSTNNPITNRRSNYDMMEMSAINTRV